jgi:nitrogen regulatory protein PII
MKIIRATIRPQKLAEVTRALDTGGFGGLNVIHATRRGAQKRILHAGCGRGVHASDTLPLLKIEVVTNDVDVDDVAEIIAGAARTDESGNGEILIVPVEEVVHERSGERGENAA